MSHIEGTNGSAISAHTYEASLSKARSSLAWPDRLFLQGASAR